MKVWLNLAALLLATPAAAEPEPWQMGFGAAASPVAQRLYEFHDLLNVIIIAIALFVMALLVIAIFRFNRKANPTPSKRTHHTGLEVAWTVVPVIILALIAVPSIRVLYFMDKAQDAEMTLKVVGHQWYWSYEYPDHGGLAFDAVITDEEDLQPGQPRLLSTDNAVVLPVDTTVRLLLASDDVIHSWAVPALAVKLDTVPGRLNETWVKILQPGTYYGQCSELCGINHGFMPIVIRAVAKEEFAAWLIEAREAFASRAPLPTVLAMGSKTRGEE